MGEKDAFTPLAERSAGCVPERQVCGLRYWLSRCLAVATILYATVFSLGIISRLDLSNERRHGQDQKIFALAAKPSLEVHIMSKCPDAKDCLHDLVVPVMANMSDQIDFTLSYIGQEVDRDEEVICKHGPSECLGNILELCAVDLYPDPKIYLGFTMCMTEDYSHIAQRDLVEGCALEHGIDFDELNRCASRDDGEYGLTLLKKSVRRTNDAGVKYSCTVRLNDDIRCIRDGGTWKDCDGGHKPEDLIHDIKQLL